MITAANQLNDQLFKGAPLPSELPVMFAEVISIDSLRDHMEPLKQMLVQVTGKSSPQLIGELQDWCNLGLQRVSLLVTWYSLATRVQKDESTLSVLESRRTIVQQRLQNVS